MVMTTSSTSALFITSNPSPVIHHQYFITSSHHPFL